ncbi:MAG: ATP-binding protein [Clostridia bacterium]|nr:ATP-binding protein [Clostridia bacterium]
MGSYFNPRNKKFGEYTRRKIFVDKTRLIGYLNRYMTEISNYICVTRPRRFGKSFAADMLTAYYSRGCDSYTLFKDFDIATDPSFEQHLNKYNVIYVDVSGFMKLYPVDATIPFILKKLQTKITSQMFKEYPEATTDEDATFSECLEAVYDASDIPFVFLIDEWDAVFRNRKDDVEGQTAFLNWLESMLKGKEYVSLTYMTGILPIKKYATGSALNMFREYTMIDPGPVKEYIGFTSEEVEKLARDFEISFDDLRYWYDGYNLDGVDIYNSNSVYWALTDKDVHGYWSKTESFEDLLGYVKENRFGIHKVLLDLVNGEKRSVSFKSYNNDLTTINNLYDILAILVHLGYLAFDKKCPEEESEKTKFPQSDEMTGAESVSERGDSDGTVRIPNHEIYEEFVAVLANLGSLEANKFEELSAKIVSLTMKGESDEDMETLAGCIEKIHGDYVSNDYNYDDEHELSNTVRLAYFAVINDYYSRTEASSGHGRADVVFTPRKGRTCLPMVMEFKVDDTAESALKQIKDLKYHKNFFDYAGDVILLGIVYDSKTQKHTVKKEVMTVDNTKFF